MPYQAFRAADDEYIVVGILNERFWHKFCGLLDEPWLATDPRFATNEDRVRHREVLVGLLEQTFARRPVDEWARLCERHDVPYTKVNTLRELFGHPQAAAVGLVVDVEHDELGSIPTVAQAVRFGRTPTTYHAPPAALGLHTELVLAEHGYSAEEIECLSRDGVI